MAIPLINVSVQHNGGFLPGFKLSNLYTEEIFLYNLRAIANKKRNNIASTKLTQNRTDYLETTLFHSLRLDVSKYSAAIQPRVELNFSHNTLPRVKRSGSKIPGQAYDYRTS